MIVHFLSYGHGGWKKFCGFDVFCKMWLLLILCMYLSFGFLCLVLCESLWPGIWCTPVCICPPLDKSGLCRYMAQLWLVKVCLKVFYCVRKLTDSCWVLFCSLFWWCFCWIFCGVGLLLGNFPWLGLVFFLLLLFLHCLQTGVEVNNFSFSAGFTFSSWVVLFKPELMFIPTVFEGLLEDGGCFFKKLFIGGIAT